MSMQTQINKLIFIRAIRAFMVTMPIIAIYFQEHGMSIRDIFVLQVIFSIAIVVMEIPTGYLADMFGRKLAMVAGCIAATLGFFTYYLAGGFSGFVIAEILLALSVSLMSGANAALMFETLKQYGQETAYKKHQGRLLAAGNVSEASAAILGGIVGAFYSLETVFLIQWIVFAASIPIAFSLREIVDRKTMTTPPLAKILSGSFRENERLRYLNLFAGTISAATLTMVWFSQPHWESLEVPLVYFGIIWFVLNLCIAGGSLLAHKLEKWFRFRDLFLVLGLAPATLYALMSLGSTSLLALLLLPLFWIVRGIQVPIIEDYVQRECNDNDRATVLSINALASRMIFSICSPFLGWIADVWSFAAAFAASAAVFGILGIVTFLFLYAAMSRRQVA